MAKGGAHLQPPFSPIHVGERRGDCFSSRILAHVPGSLGADRCLASEIGEVMTLAENAPGLESVFKGLHRRQGGLRQTCFGAAVQHQRGAKGKIPTPVEPQQGYLGQGQTGATVPVEPADLILRNCQARGGIAPQLPKPWQGWQSQDHRHPGRNLQKNPGKPKTRKPQPQSQRQTDRAPLTLKMIGRQGAAWGCVWRCQRITVRQTGHQIAGPSGPLAIRRPPEYG